MCALIIAGVAPENAYAAAYPKVAEAGTVSDVDANSGRIAAEVLCPAT